MTLIERIKRVVYNLAAMFEELDNMASESEQPERFTDLVITYTTGAGGMHSSIRKRVRTPNQPEFKIEIFSQQTITVHTVELHAEPSFVMTQVTVGRDNMIPGREPCVQVKGAFNAQPGDAIVARIEKLP